MDVGTKINLDQFLSSEELHLKRLEGLTSEKKADYLEAEYKLEHAEKELKLAKRDWKKADLKTKIKKQKKVCEIKKKSYERALINYEKTQVLSCIDPEREFETIQTIQEEIKDIKWNPNPTKADILRMKNLENKLVRMQIAQN